MALCIEPTLKYNGLEATLVASIPAYTLTPDIEPQPEPKPKIKGTLRGTDIVSGSMRSALVSGRVRASVIAGSFGHTAVGASLRQSASMIASLTSPQHPKATLSAKPSVTATLGISQLIGAELNGRMVDAYLVVSCPIDYITSCYSLGGWNDDLGWDNNQGWKD